MIEIIKIEEVRRRREKLARVKARSVAADAELMSVVVEIVGEVRRMGDAALLDYTARFDGVRLAPGGGAVFTLRLPASDFGF